MLGTIALLGWCYGAGRHPKATQEPPQGECGVRSAECGMGRKAKAKAGVMRNA